MVNLPLSVPDLPYFSSYPFIPLLSRIGSYWELQNFEQIDDYNTSASSFFDRIEGFGRLVYQVTPCNINLLVECRVILLEGSRMARSQNQGVAKLLSRCVTYY